VPISSLGDYHDVGPQCGGLLPLFFVESNPDVTICSFKVENPSNQNTPSPSHVAICLEIQLRAQADRLNIKFENRFSILLLSCHKIEKPTSITPSTWDQRPKKDEYDRVARPTR
jgi:hypothetical protein